MYVLLAGTDKTHFEFGSVREVAPGDAEADDGNRRQHADEQSGPEVAGQSGLHSRGGKHEDETVNALFLNGLLVFLLAHPKRATEGRPAIATATPATRARLGGRITLQTGARAGVGEGGIGPAAGWVAVT